MVIQPQQKCDLSVTIQNCDLSIKHGDSMWISMGYIYIYTYICILSSNFAVSDGNMEMKPTSLRECQISWEYHGKPFAVVTHILQTGSRGLFSSMIDRNSAWWFSAPKLPEAKPIETVVTITQANRMDLPYLRQTGHVHSFSAFFLGRQNLSNAATIDDTLSLE